MVFYKYFLTLNLAGELVRQLNFNARKNIMG
jgi:hypothetical protein